MATVRKNNKKKIIVIISIVLAVALIATGTSLYVADSKIPQVSLYTIGTSNIYESINSSGTVSAGAVKSYTVGSFAVVKEVFVNVGDEVKEGDILATFDTSNYDEQISSMQASYSQAKASYNDAVASQKEAKNNLAQINKQIEELEKEISELEKKIAKDIESLSKEQPTTLPASSSGSSSAYNFAGAVTQLTDTINGLADDPRVNGALLSVVFSAIANELANGNTSSDAIATAVEAAVKNAAENGIIDSSQLSVDLDTAVKNISKTVKSINWSVGIAGDLQSITEGVTIPSMDAGSIIQSISESDSVKLASDRITLSSCYAQQQLYTALASDTVVETRKELMNTTESAIKALEEARDELSAGWTAAFDGVITECSIFPGEQASLLAGGITLQNMDSLVVTISLGEYDIHKVKVDMPVTISSAYGTYSGKVIFKAPVAGGGGSGASSFVDSFGSMMGISGLSSLTDTGSGVEVRISVDDPDENIIVGFDAAVEIHIGEFIGVPTVPAESMLHDKNGTYVYLYNEEEGTVTKTQIETGSMSYTEYEVVSGLKEGDRIVFAPQSTFEDNFEVKVAK